MLLQVLYQSNFQVKTKLKIEPGGGCRKRERMDWILALPKNTARMRESEVALNHSSKRQVDECLYSLT